MLRRANLIEWLFLVGWPILVIVLVLTVAHSAEKQQDLALHNHSLIMENQKIIKENQALCRQKLDVIIEHTKKVEARWK